MREHYSTRLAEPQVDIAERSRCSYSKPAIVLLFFWLARIRWEFGAASPYLLRAALCPMICPVKWLDCGVSGLSESLD
jgi:hypothetical protein